MITKYTDINDLRKEITGIKKKLITKVKRKGLYENFGQKELRYLSDKYFIYDQAIASELTAFNNWAVNYTGEK